MISVLLVLLAFIIGATGMLVAFCEMLFGRFPISAPVASLAVIALMYAAYYV